LIPIHDDNPTTIKPVVTMALIVACTAVFVLQTAMPQASGQRLIYALGVIPAVLLGDSRLAPDLVMVPSGVTVLTSMFLHGSWMHLLGNMLYLWIFGNNVEDSMGHVRYAIFYLLCGTVAVFAQALPHQESTVPMIGASGAISGVLGAYLLLFPRARVLVIIPLGFIAQAVRLPALIVLGLWFVLQLLSSALAPAGQAGVAFGAHIGGFVAGTALIIVFKHRRVRLLGR
jgi:membrane associated rhomboid family serine protease